MSTHSLLSRRLISSVCLATLFTLAAAAEPAETPRLSDASVRLSLFAEAPDIVTPIGATVDAKGRLLVVESHTHFRPKDYKGPAADRIRMFEDTTGSGRADKITTVFEGEKYLMNVAAEKDGSVVVSSRNEIFRLSGDGKKSTIAHLETKSDYPHNGLHGLTIDSAGNLYVGIGENFGGAWTLVGTDGRTVSGDKGSGAVFRMDAQGRGLTQVCHGFWNPFGLGIDPAGNIFGVDNDPDGRPPCRLFQVLPGADYGYEFRYGRTGLHPLQAWDGELPGTLGMIAGVGEAPCAVLWHNGKLLVSSWRDHVVQSITLVPRGAGYTATVESLLSGGDTFRPVGLAAAADGSVFVTDWVANSYPVHGKGKIWKLVFNAPATGAVTTLNAAHKRTAELRESKDVPTLVAALDDEDPIIDQAAQIGLAQLSAVENVDWAALKSPRQRIGLLASLLIHGGVPQKLVESALNDTDDRVRQMGVRVIAELNLKEERAPLASLMESKTLSPRLLGMIAATLGQLDGDPAAKVDPKKINAVLVGRLDDPKSSDDAKASALHMLLANHPHLPMEKLAPLAHSSDVPLQREAVRYLNDDTDAARFDLLQSVATDAKADKEVRAEAIDGLTDDAAKRVDILLSLAADTDPTLRQEAMRSLRPVGAKLTSEQQAKLIEAAKGTPAEADQVSRLLNKPLPERPADTEIDAWQKLLDTGTGDPEAGRRIFFHSSGGGCFRCHMLEGRGRAIGPDLTMIGHSQTREHVLESILQPSKDIAPLFTLWTIKTKSGQVVDGMLLRRDGQSNEVYVDSAGQEIHVKESDVADRKMRKESLMPTGLAEGMTTQELRDVIALLMQKR